MQVGVVTFATDRGPSPAALAAAVEDRGLEALFVTEHTHFPIDPGPTPWGAPAGEEYGRTLDPFVALAAAATSTDRIALGTAVSLLAQRDPITTAKAAASVDHLSAGRLVLGVGYGWCRPELEDHGVEFARRRERVAEHVAAMRALWHPEPTGFEGETVRFGPAAAHPKPHRGHLPVYLGAPLAPTSLAHLRDWADGWLPSDRPTLLEDRTRLLETVGPLPTTVVGPRPDPARLTELAEAGVERVLLWLPPWPAEDVLRTLDQHAVLATAVAP
jgi:probable F420-dependent oxidoreductase